MSTRGIDLEWDYQMHEFNSLASSDDWDGKAGDHYLRSGLE